MRRLLPLLLLAACQTAGHTRLDQVGNWAMQLQGLEHKGAVARLVAADVDMLVIDPTRTVRGLETFPTRDVVQQIRRGGALCLAYVNVGQAEDYRTYWTADWKAPAVDARGHPSYIVSADPEGWAGNYPVAFWDIRWKAVLWGSRRSLVDMAIADGFDGVYLDWVLGYEEPTVARLHGNPAGAMRDLLRDLRDYARKRKPGFLVIAQNGAELPGLGDVVDGYAQECLSFTGKPGAAWSATDAGDIALPDRDERAKLADAVGVPVFSVDYATIDDVARAARAFSRQHGFVPFVSRVSLDRLP